MLAREIGTIHPQARTATARTARRRTARSRAARPLLVTPRPHHLRSSIRTARRLRTDPRLIRPDDPLPPRPQRRPQTQPGAAHDPRHQTPITPQQPLPPTQTRTTAGDLDDKHRSITGPRGCRLARIPPPRFLSRRCSARCPSEPARHRPGGVPPAPAFADMRYAGVGSARRVRRYRWAHDAEETLCPL